jgi:putative transposase
LLKAVLGKKRTEHVENGNFASKKILNKGGRTGMKRLFRATRKINAPHFVSHITQRAAGREPLFIEEKDYLFMVWLLKEIAHKYSLKIHAFCLMPNHLHLLLSPEEENLYDAMRDLFSRYAMRFNRVYERKGHLFGGPYRQAMCLDETYLLAASLYIHLNPIKAGLSGDPTGYRWSSCRLYCDEDVPKSFVVPDSVLDLLSGNESERKEKYRILLSNGAGLKIDEVHEDKEAIERFKSGLASRVPSIFKWIAERKREDRTSGLDLFSLDELESRIEAMKNDPAFRKRESMPAKKYIIEQLTARGYKRKEIAERLGVSRKTVYNISKWKG